MELDPKVVEQARAQIVTAARRLAARGWCEALSGAISVKVKDVPTRFVVTADGADLANLCAEDTVVVNGSGEASADELKRPMRDTRLHVKIYAVVPDARAVVHCLPPHVVALSRVLRKKGQVSLRGLEHCRAFEGVDDIEDAGLKLPIEPSEQDLDRMVTRALAHRKEHVPAVSFEGRGLAAWGSDLKAAVRHTEAIEAMCQVLSLERALGG